MHKVAVKFGLADFPFDFMWWSH